MTSIPPILIAATGLRREARIVSGPGVLTVSGGGDATRLEAELERLGFDQKRSNGKRRWSGIAVPDWYAAAPRK